MKLEEQVSSLELSKKLKGLGVKQESLFYWELLEDDEKLWKPRLIYHKMIDHRPFLGSKTNYSAFTVAELGELLKTKDKQVYTNYIEEDDDWVCVFKRWKGYAMRDFLMTVNADTEADARAKMLCYLLENGLIK